MLNQTFCIHSAGIFAILWSILLIGCNLCNEGAETQSSKTSQMLFGLLVSKHSVHRQKVYFSNP